MKASVHFSTLVTRMRRGSPNSDGLARVSSSPGPYWSASRSLTSRLGSSVLRVSRSSRIARSASTTSVPETSTTGAGRTLSHASCGMLGALALPATPPAYREGPSRDLAVQTSTPARPATRRMRPSRSVRTAVVPTPRASPSEPCRSDARSRCRRRRRSARPRRAHARRCAAIWSADPWCATLTTSTAEKRRRRQQRVCGSSPRSPRNSELRHPAATVEARSSRSRRCPGSMPPSGSRGHSMLHRRVAEPPGQPLRHLLDLGARRRELRDEPIVVGTVARTDERPVHHAEHGTRCRRRGRGRSG